MIRTLSAKARYTPKSIYQGALGPAKIYKLEKKGDKERK